MSNSTPINVPIKNKTAYTINFIVSTLFLLWYVVLHPADFMLGAFLALPFSWLIVYLIFREVQVGGVDRHTVGQQLSLFTSKVFTIFRYLAAFLFILGQFWYKERLSVDVLFGASNNSSFEIVSLVYVVVVSIITEITILALYFDLKRLVGKRNPYGDGYNPKSKRQIAIIALCAPFLILFFLYLLGRYYQ